MRLRSPLLKRFVCGSRRLWIRRVKVLGGASAVLLPNTFDGWFTGLLESLPGGSSSFWEHLEIIASEPSTLANSHSALLVLI
jgi:hypothetical protein